MIVLNPPAKWIPH